MLSFGFLALGAFIGAVVGVFLISAKDWSNPMTGLTAILGAAVSGAPITLAKLILGGTGLSASLSMYPVGLVLGILCPYLQFAAANFTDPNAKARWIGIFHFAGFGAVVLFGLAAFLVPETMASRFGKVDEYFIDLLRMAKTATS